MIHLIFAAENEFVIHKLPKNCHPGLDPGSSRKENLKILQKNEFLLLLPSSWLLM